MTALFRLLYFLTCNLFSLIFIQAIIFQCRSTDPCGCSRNNVDINIDSTGDETAVYRSWNWAVSIRNSYNMHICGGTILSKHFILTAAHCFRKDSEEFLPYTVIMGVDSLLNTSGQIRFVSEIYIHPKWNPLSNENDIALIKLTRSINMYDKNIAKICLPNIIKWERINYPILHSLLVAIGWGTTSWDDFISPMYLRQVTLETIDNSELKCNNLIKNINIQFCATIKKGRKDICQGDSGGPIMHFSSEKHRWILTGIISYGYQCDLLDYTGVYTRISVYIDWIKYIVGDDGIVLVSENNSILQTASTPMTLISLLLLLLFIRLLI